MTPSSAATDADLEAVEENASEEDHDEPESSVPIKNSCPENDRENPTSNGEREPFLTVSVDEDIAMWVRWTLQNNCEAV